MLTDITWLIAAAVIIDGLLAGLAAAVVAWAIKVTVQQVRRARARRYVTVPVIEEDVDGAIHIAAVVMHRNLTTAGVKTGARR